MVVILDLGDGLDEGDQKVYDEFVDSIRGLNHAGLWTFTDPVPEDCKRIPPGVVGYMFHADLQGESPLLHVPPPTTAEEVQAYFALDVEKVADQIFRLIARDVIKDAVYVAPTVYDPTPTHELARRHLDDLLATHGYATT